MKARLAQIFLLIAALVWSGPRSTKAADGSQPPVRAANGMVASVDEIASRVGVDVLRRGGNAVDAAVAVGLALAVTHPSAGNLGGGGFMLIRLANGKTTAIDYRETAPARASRDMYLDAQGNVRPGASTVGYLAGGVPGTVAGLARALEKYGTLSWAEAVEPARKLAADGFVVDPTLAASLRGADNLKGFAESRRIFQRDGNFYQPGETFQQPELAATLRRLQAEGPREFYHGETARLLAEDMAANGGGITREDLRRYRIVERAPIRGTYRGYEILSMPPPSSGGIAIIEMLNMLEKHDLRALGHQSFEASHLLIEVMRRAFADRAKYPGDPSFVRVPWRGLTHKRYAARQARSINPNRATPSSTIRAGRPYAYESPQTTHYSVVDKHGNAVANTYTLNSSYGGGATIRGAGFLMNNEMDDFTSRPGVPNQFGLVQGKANAIASGKRPLSSMSPTIVLKDGELFYVTGSPGGPTIISAVLQSIINVVDFGLDPQAAANAGRLHHQWLPDEVWHEPNSLSAPVLEKLKAAGHVFRAEPQKLPNAVEGILLDAATGALVGGADLRHTPAMPVGY